MIERELEALVAVSSPSGDMEGAEECVALATAFLPARGGGRARALLDPGPRRGPGRPPARHRHAAGCCCSGTSTPSCTTPRTGRSTRDGDRLTGSGAVDMKGGVALSLALMRELAERPELYAEVAILLVNDEEWRTAPFIHAERFAGFDACLCFEGGERTAQGDEAVIVKRKAAATLRVNAHGRSSHSGSAPELGRSALLALTATAQLVASHNDPAGPDRLTAVPDDPALGRRLQRRARRGRAAVRPARRPAGGVRPGLRGAPERARGGAARADDGARVARAGLARAPRLTCSPRRASGSAARSWAPSAAARATPATSRPAESRCTIDGLGPLGGGAHTPDEWVSLDSLTARYEVARAVAHALLGA